MDGWKTIVSFWDIFLAGAMFVANVPKSSASDGFLIDLAEVFPHNATGVEMRNR